MAVRRGRRSVAAAAEREDSVHLQAALDPKHVDNSEHAVAQGSGPQLIRELINVCGALSIVSNVVGRQTAAERHASSTVRGPAREGDLVSAVDFFKKLELGKSHRQPPVAQLLSRRACDLWRGG